MKAVRQKNTRPEITLAEGLKALGVRCRRHYKKLPGQPDFFFPRDGLVVFVHGCFWHGHTACKKGKAKPKTRRKYWIDKIERNRQRDRRIARELRSEGFSVFTIWECEIKKKKVPERLITKLQSCGILS